MRPEIIKYEENLPIKVSVNSVTEYPLHWHNSLEIIIVLKGSINVCLSYEKFLLKENEVAIISDNDVHKIYKTDEENRILFLQIDQRFYENNCENSKHTFFVPYVKESEKKHADKINMLLKYVGEIVWEINEKAGGYQMQVESISKYLLTFLVKNFEYVRFEADNLKISEIQIERYQRLAAYVFENYMNKVSLQELADKEHLSLYYLSHDIKDRSGYTFQEIVNACRVEPAAKLLLATDKKISEIALECGFSDARYFNKHFKKYYNYSPSEFRKRHKVEDHILQEMKKCEELHISTSLERLESYIDKNNGKKPKRYTSRVEMLSIDINSKSKVFYPYWKECINLSSAKYALTNSYQNYLREIQNDIGFRYIRMSRILDDEMEVYNEDADGNSIYYWHYVDEILKFFQRVNIKPIINFDSMSVPLEKCPELMKDFLSHCKREYGLKEIESWEIEVPRNKYSKFYEEIIAVIESFSSSIKVSEGKKSEFIVNFLCDTIFMAPYVVHNAVHTKDGIPFIEPVDSIYSDEKTKVYNYVFFGGSGLISSYGLKKASYYTYYLLSQLGDKLVEKGNGYVVTKKDENIQIFVYNHDDTYSEEDISSDNRVSKHSFFDLNQGKEIVVNLVNLVGSYRITRYELNEKHGSVFDHWVSMGKPDRLSGVERELLDRTVFPKVSFNYMKKTNIDLTVKLPPHGVELITLEKIN